MSSSQDTIQYSVKLTYTETHTLTKDGLKETLWLRHLTHTSEPTDDDPKRQEQKQLLFKKKFDKKFETLWKRICAMSPTVFHKMEGSHFDIPQPNIPEGTNKPDYPDWGLRAQIDDEFYDKL